MRGWNGNADKTVFIVFYPTRAERPL